MGAVLKSSKVAKPGEGLKPCTCNWESPQVSTGVPGGHKVVWANLSARTGFSPEEGCLLQKP